MTKIIISAISLISILASFASANYKTLLNDVESYQAPAPLVTDPVYSIEPEKTLSIPALKRLTQRKTDWLKFNSPHELAAGFYQPDQKLLATIQASPDQLKSIATLLKQAPHLEELEVITLLRNPGIHAAFKKWRASLEAFDYVTYLDETLRQYTAFTEGSMLGIGPMKGRDSIMMKFPFPAVTALKGAIVEEEVTIAKEHLTMAYRDALTATRKAYWRLLYLNQAQQITNDILGLLEHLAEVVVTRYEAGQTNYQDYVKIQIKREILQETLVTLKEEERVIQAKLRALLDLPNKVIIRSPHQAPLAKIFLKPQALYVQALTQRPELRQMRAKINKMEYMLEMAETMILPNYTLNLSFYNDQALTQVGSSATKQTFATKTTASQGLGQPLRPWQGVNDAYLRETRQKLASLKNTLANAEAQTTFMVRKAWFNWDKARRDKILLDNTIINLARTSLDSALQGYETGKVTFADLITAYNLWFDINLKQSAKQSDQGAAKAELEQIIGVTL